jgi:hypothetical protein
VLPPAGAGGDQRMLIVVRSPTRIIETHRQAQSSWKQSAFADRRTRVSLAPPEGCPMNPKMLNIELLDVLIYIRKGRCVIDRTETDWGRARLLDREYIEVRFVYSKNETKDCLGSRFDPWWNDKERWIKPTLEQAMRFADDAANGRSEEAAKRHEEALLERKIDDLEKKCWILKPQLVQVLGGPQPGLFKKSPYENPAHLVPNIFLSQQERYQQASAKYEQLLKEIAERPALPGTYQQLALDINGSSDSTIPPSNTEPPWRQSRPPFWQRQNPPLTIQTLDSLKRRDEARETEQTDPEAEAEAALWNPIQSWDREPGTS